ncbi:MAG: flagellar hook capping FlgD N-terminal domain-containing protein [Syntrophomonadaceae bacterium]|nr:flagellar hook capping FlgD N-terminal domain-containing protein [Syntrophomonadaceae bacterium]
MSISSNLTVGQSPLATVSTGSLNSVLGKEAFLKLLITQLRSQNPLEPVKDTDFIAQMAQFSTLEQMQNLNTSLEVLAANSKSSAVQGLVGYAVSLIGKEVRYQDEGEQQGTVESVRIENGVPRLVVNQQLVALDQLIEVKQIVSQA